MTEKVLQHHKTSAERPSSPHLLDLTEKDGKKLKALARARETERKPRAWIFRMIDRHIHLHDIRSRTLSIRPRGWRDFPPKTAITLPQAIGMTFDRFFREHPLAELTVLATAHLLAVFIWNLFLAPPRVIRRLLTAPKPAPAKRTLPVMPFMTVSGELRAASFELEKKPPLTAQSSKLKAQSSKLRLAWQLPGGWQKSVLGFSALSLLLVLPFGAASMLSGLRDQKTAVVNNGMDAVRMLTDAGAAAKAQDFAAAGLAFEQAESRFADARKDLGVMGKFFSSAAALLPMDSRISAAGPALIAGKELAAGGSIISQGFAAVDGESDPVKKIESLRSHFAASLPHLTAAEGALSKVSPKSIPAEYRPAFESARLELPKLAESIRQATAIAGLLPSILGANGAKRYLVLFQNNAELRPTGGFIGSFALLDVKNGKLAGVEIPGGGSYDLKGSLRAKLVSPQPLHLINPHWQFQDANWSPDFPTSAKTLRWFYEKSGGPTTDGVIALTATLMERLLEVTGPIEMPEYGKTIDAGNFYFETQKEVELDYDKAENKPKKFIGDLAPKVLGKLLDADQQTYAKLISILDKSLEEKHLLMWFADTEAQSRIADFGWTGELKDAEGDYLAMVHANIGGQKTDLAMKDDIDHAVKLLPDGSAIVTLTLSRTHTGTKGALFSGARNVDFLRVYVPLGSTLVEARGFRQPDPKLFKLANADYTADPNIAAQEDGTRVDRSSGTRISTDAGKTVFGNWLQTDPGETTVATVVYRLPPGTVKVPPRREGRLAGLYQKLFGQEGPRLSYSLLVQKQPGTMPAKFTSRIDAPRGFDLSWQSDERKADDRGRWTLTRMLDRDGFTGVLLQSR